MRSQIAVKTVPGVIDSLTDGFGLVNRFLWVLVFPIALDALLWLGPRVTALPLVEQFLTLYRQALAEYGGDPFSAAGGPDPRVVETFGRSFGEMNLLTYLAWNPAGAAVPSFVASLTTGVESKLLVDSLEGFLVYFVGFQLVGLLLGCLYLGLLGQLVREGRPSLWRLPERSGRYWLTFLAFVGMLVGATLMISIVIALLAIISLSVAVFVSAALTTAAFFVGLLLVFYLFFFVDAVVVGELGVIDALKSSVQTVRVSFWSSLGLILLTFLIGQGMFFIWSRLAEQPWGIALSVVGNSYVASGLIAASMLFYRSRMLRPTAATTVPVERLNDN